MFVLHRGVSCLYYTEQYHAESNRLVFVVHGVKLYHDCITQSCIMLK